MKIILGFYVLFGTFYILKTLKILDIRNTRGRCLFKLSKKKGLLIFYITVLLFFINNLVLRVRRDLIFYEKGNFSILTLSLIGIFSSLTHISTNIKYSEINEKGIYLSRGFYDWSNIYCYEWVSSDTINFKATSSFLCDHEEKVKIHYGDKTKLDEVLQKYIIECTAYDCKKN